MPEATSRSAGGSSQAAVRSELVVSAGVRSKGRCDAQPDSVKHSVLDFAARALNIGSCFGQGTTEWRITIQFLLEQS
jgi:hypothetical protein